MPYEDKTIVCVDCNAEFKFTAEEQKQFAERRIHQRSEALQNLPRCAEGIANERESGGWQHHEQRQQRRRIFRRGRREHWRTGRIWSWRGRRRGWWWTVF